MRPLTPKDLDNLPEGRTVYAKDNTAWTKRNNNQWFQGPFLGPAWYLTNVWGPITATPKDTK